MAHDIPVLRELLLLAGVSLVVLMLFQRLRLPAAVGFIVTGVLLGPGGFRLIGDLDLVHVLAEIGVVLLLFTVGLEFSPTELRRLGRRVTVAGALQVFVTVGLVTAALLAAGLHPARALFFGLLLSLSSTALVLKLLTDRAELASPHGRVATGVLVFQDLMVIPFAIAVPFLAQWLAGAGPATGGTRGVLGQLALLAAVALVFLWAGRVVPWLLGRASRLRSREAFLFGVVVVALGSAYLTSQAGLSLALGAFLAGVILAESDLRAQIAADLGPFRDTFASIFFITIGMLLEPRLLITEPVIVLASTIGLVGAKAIVALFALRWSGTSWRVALAGGVTLSQVGEFSFVLAEAARPSGLLGELGGQAFFAGAVFSLMLTPLFVARAPEWALAVERRLAGRWVPATAGGDTAAAHSPLYADHVIVAGFGLNGRNLARVLRSVHVPHMIVDLNPEILDPALREDSAVLLGDIANPAIQRQAGVPRARVLVLALSDPTATRHACRLARSQSREVFIIVRTRYVAEIDELYRLGANQVIPEEFETSIEIFTAALRQFHVPMNLIQAQVALLRQERYSLLRGLRLPGAVVEELDAILAQGTADTFLLLQHSPAIGRTLAEAGLAVPAAAEAAAGGELGIERASVLAVVRGGHVFSRPGEDFRLQVGDTLVLAGSHAEMDRAFGRLSPAPSE